MRKIILKSVIIIASIIVCDLSSGLLLADVSISFINDTNDILIKFEKQINDNDAINIKKIDEYFSSYSNDWIVQLNSEGGDVRSSIKIGKISAIHVLRCSRGRKLHYLPFSASCAEPA
ncbi:MAG: hypothetical protein ACYC9M_00340, partial [Desulfobulbaceae bacterium]